jgi:hypothetical protein
VGLDPATVVNAAIHQFPVGVCNGLVARLGSAMVLLPINASPEAPSA